MRIAGQREDGALYLALGSGLAVILKGARVSPTLDLSLIEPLGPWTPADNSFHARRAAARALDLAHVASLDHFHLYDLRTKKLADPPADAPVADTPVPDKKKKKEAVLPAPEDIAAPAAATPAAPGAVAAPAAVPAEEPEKKKPAITLDIALQDNATRFAWLLDSTTIARTLQLQKDEHPFTYCKEHIIPAMAKEGKEPDDPDAFCAWYKQEGPGSE